MQYYATCEVLRDSEASCPEPEASAHDHHEGEIPVRKTVKLYIKSDAKQQPKLLDQTVPAVSYRQRGEYTLTYDASDLRTLVRVKVADDNDLRPARQGLERAAPPSSSTSSSKPTPGIPSASR